MAKQQDPYSRARAAFADLDLKDRALFLAREAVETIALGVEEVAQSVARDVECFFGGETKKQEQEAAPEEESAE